jgi:hypothetical protein
MYDSGIMSPRNNPVSLFQPARLEKAHGLATRWMAKILAGYGDEPPGLAAAHRPTWCAWGRPERWCRRP